MTWALQIRTAEDLAAEVQAARAEGVNAERERRLEAGALVAVAGYGEIAVQGRLVDQVNLIALGVTARDLIAQGVTEAMLPFRDGLNAMHMLTPAQMAQMVAGGVAAASAIYAASWAIKDGGSIPEDYAADIYWPAGG